MAEPGVLRVVERIGLVAVEEPKAQAAEPALEGPLHLVEEGMLEQAGADEVQQVDVVVARDIDQRQLREVIEDRPPVDEDAALVHLPQLEQVAQDEELAALGANVIDELVQLRACDRPARSYRAGLHRRGEGR